jgi:hypothetical protein
LISSFDKTSSAPLIKKISTILLILSVLELVAVILLLDIKKQAGIGSKYDKLLLFNVCGFVIFLLLSLSVYSLSYNEMGWYVILILLMGIMAYSAAFIVFLAIPNLGLGLSVSVFGQLKTRQDISDKDVKKKMDAILGLIFIPNWILVVITGIMGMFIVATIGNIVF